MNIINDYENIYIYSPSLHQDFNQKLIKGFINYIPINIILNILNEEDIDLVINEIVNDKDFNKSDTKIETNDSKEELKLPQENEDRGINIQDDLNEKERNDPRVQARFQRSRHINLSIFIISEDYYEIPKRTIRADGNFYHILKPNNFRDVQNLYQDKARMDM